MVVVAVLGVVFGALAQRVSGMGFAMLVGPLFVLAFGAFEGVLLINILGAFVSLIILTKVWRLVVWRYYFKLVPPAIATIFVGSWVTVWLDSDVLQVIVGLVIMAGLTLSILSVRAEPRIIVGKYLPVAGFFSGFSSSTAGIGGPPMGIYGILSGWEQRQFSATLQPFFVTLGTLSFVVKVALSGTPPTIVWWLWLVLIALTLVGLWLGQVLAPRVNVEQARQLVILICYAGAILATADGVISLVNR